jgi:hypothetical protein
VPFDGYDDHGHLLSRGGERCQQPPFPVGTADTQVFVSKLELVKLQVHRDRFLSVPPACGNAGKTSIPARDILSTVVWFYPRQDNDLRTEGSA